MIFVGDTPLIVMTVFDDGDALDISSATVKLIKIAGPGLETMSKGAEFYTDGTDGKLKYQCVESDFSVAGTWEVQAYLEMPGWSGHSGISRFNVHENL